MGSEWVGVIKLLGSCFVFALKNVRDLNQQQTDIILPY